jgi:hypothetical protein
MTETSYNNDKNSLMKWFSGIAASLVIIILTGIYTKLDTMTKFMIKSEMQIEQLKDKNTMQDGQIKQLEEMVFIRPKELKITTDE